MSEKTLYAFDKVSAAIHRGQLPEGFDDTLPRLDLVEEGTVPLEEGTVLLEVQSAQIHGAGAGRGPDYIGGWGNPATFVSWEFEAPEPGKYTVMIHAACASDHGGDIEVVLDGTVLAAKVKDTSNFANPQIYTIGTVDIAESARTCHLSVKPIRMRKEGRVLMNLHAIRLVPVAAGTAQ